ncbi:MAG: 2TM domain-containing protein [Bacteroides sp.]|nr:2TM domain-containing protein [Bacteroides sp.]
MNTLMNQTEKMRKYRFEAITSIVTYVLVNSFLVFVNWMTSSTYWWVFWVIGGWGLGLIISLVSGYLEIKCNINK